jgi:hypothetical protein
LDGDVLVAHLPTDAESSHKFPCGCLVTEAVLDCPWPAVADWPARPARATAHNPVCCFCMYVRRNGKLNKAAAQCARCDEVSCAACIGLAASVVDGGPLSLIRLSNAPASPLSWLCPKCALLNLRSCGTGAAKLCPVAHPHFQLAVVLGSGRRKPVRERLALRSAPRRSRREGAHRGGQIRRGEGRQGWRDRKDAGEEGDHQGRQCGGKGRGRTRRGWRGLRGGRGGQGRGSQKRRPRRRGGG